MKRYVQQKDNSIETQELEGIHYIVAGIEIVNILKQELDDSSHKIITTVSMEKLNRELLLELEVKEEDLHNSYRKYLKQLILENIPGLSFKRSPHANEAQLLFEKHVVSSIDSPPLIEKNLMILTWETYALLKKFIEIQGWLLLTLLRQNLSWFFVLTFENAFS